MKTILSFFVLTLLSFHAISSPLIIPITIDGKRGGNKINISWTISENELAQIFELEKSIDGKNFTSCAIVFATSKVGDQRYSINEKDVNQAMVVYRVKLVYKSDVVYYSNILLFKLKEEKEEKKVQLLGNPVATNAVLAYDANEIKPVLFNVYSAGGKFLFSKKADSMKGENIFQLPVQQLQSNSYFIIEVVLQNGKRETVKFLKR